MALPSTGQEGWRLSVALPAISPFLTRLPKSRPKGYWGLLTVAQPHTSIPKLKSDCCSKPALSSNQQVDCAHTHTSRSLGLSCTGLRISEALKLTDDDTDLDRGVLAIRQTKFHKSRLVPLHSSAKEALEKYADLRDHLFPIRSSRTFFISGNGKALPYSTVNYVFLTLSRRLGWNCGNMSLRCRIYDLRHTFATRQIALWQEQGADVSARLLTLSTYIGHVKVSDTYWYLSAIPELFAATVEAFERYACKGQGGSA